MPQFEKLSPEEVQKLGRRRQPAVDLSRYQEFLDNATIGEWGRIYLEEGDTQRTVKRRLTTAAKDRNMAVRYRKAPEGQILFQITEPPPPPSAAAAAAPARGTRGGRGRAARA